LIAYTLNFRSSRAPGALRAPGETSGLIRPFGNECCVGQPHESTAASTVGMRCTDSTNTCVWARFLPPNATLPRTTSTTSAQSAGAGAQPHPPGPAAGTVCSDSDRSIFRAPGTWHFTHQERACRLTLRFPSSRNKRWVCHFRRSLALALSCRRAFAGVCAVPATVPRKVGPPTSVGQQPRPIARFADVGWLSLCRHRDNCLPPSW